MFHDFPYGAVAQLARFVGGLPRAFGWSVTLTAPTPTARVGAYLWSREPGRFLSCPEPGARLWSREAGRFLTMPANAGPYDWIGKRHLPCGGLAGGMRQLGIYFGNMEEILGGETLTGTPVVTVGGSPAYPAITSPAVNAAPVTIIDNGRTITAAVGTLVTFFANAGTADEGEFTVSVHVATTGGAVYEPIFTLVLEDSRE
jgi:hypothetical protein